jgi:hypothetical protein
VRDADHGAERPILALVEAAKAVEVPEQLVSAVDEMNDHVFVAAASSTCQCCSAVRLLQLNFWSLSFIFMENAPVKGNVFAIKQQR